VIQRREIKKRLGVARQEVVQWKNFDYLLVEHSIRRICGACSRSLNRADADARAQPPNLNEQEHRPGRDWIDPPLTSGGSDEPACEAGMDVHVVMTTDALRFITDLPFKTLSRIA